MKRDVLKSLDTVKEYIDHECNKHIKSCDNCKFHSICSMIDNGAFMDVGTIIEHLIYDIS